MARCLPAPDAILKLVDDVPLASARVALAGEVDALALADAAIEFYDVPEGRFSGFQPPPPSWAKAG
ncbi:hypothetical protein LJR164_002971 [Phenylobacterium sp. LjRoot164]|uniref:hypothetical protein n=1 Tax=unclassified Phenylobacterium TaxID=2640670 RepID=UPI003ECE3504